MLIPILGVKLYTLCYRRGIINAQCYTWIEALYSMLYMK